MSSWRQEIDRSFLSSEPWLRAVELTYHHLRGALVGPIVASEQDVALSLDRTKSSGFFGYTRHLMTTGEWLDAMDVPLYEYCARHMRTQRYPTIYVGHMKIEFTAREKVLKRRQRMFLIQNKETVVLHKKYFGLQSKRLRQYKSIAHGQTFFFGNAHLFAESRERVRIDSEDDTFWDKNYSFMSAVYQLRMRGLRDSPGYTDLTSDDQFLIENVIAGFVEVIVIVPGGSICRIRNRTNPSGADATTENNCIARYLVECYMQIIYNTRFQTLVSDKTGTMYLGDDRIASMDQYEDGYSEFYEREVKTIGVDLKTLKRTNGIADAEFAGFTFKKTTHLYGMWIPHYSYDKIVPSLFYRRPEDNTNIILSRLMAYGILLYPRTEFQQLQSAVVKYLQQFRQHPLHSVAVAFWTDETTLRYIWTGRESGCADQRLVDKFHDLLAEWTEGGIFEIDVSDN